MPEPSVEEAYKILKGLKSRFEAHHKLQYTDKVLRVASEMAARYITDRFLPDKAIDVIDEAGAFQQLQAPSKRKVLGPRISKPWSRKYCESRQRPSTVMTKSCYRSEAISK